MNRPDLKIVHRGARYVYKDATDKVACPVCGQQPGGICRTPRGSKLTEPHARRVWAFQHTPGYNMDDYLLVKKGAK